MKKLILASQSPRRHDIFKMVGFNFCVAKSNIIEKLNPRLSPRKQAEILSFQKAKSVSHRFKNSIVIGFDTIVNLENEMFGKPETSQIASIVLKKLQGKTHFVITAYTIIDTETNKYITNSVETKVTIKKMNYKDIEWYINTKEPMDKAGSYAVQGKGSIFIDKIEGDYFNVVGLPIRYLVEDLKKFNIKLK